MKRFVFMLMMIIVCPWLSLPFRESIQLEEALSLLAEWNQKAESVLLQKVGCFFSIGRK